jgi:nicotinamide-nucleotide amidase
VTYSRSRSSVAALLDVLATRGETLAVAESLTGGLLAATLVDVPGASRVFRGGLLVYATDLKASLAGVPEDLLAERGPVHPDVASALAEGARVRCQATWGLSTTGVAGPDPQHGIAPGTVYLGISGPAEGGSPVAPARTVARRFVFRGGRAAIRSSTVSAALDLLAEFAGLGA